MDATAFILGFVLGTLIGAGVALAVGLLRRRAEQRQMRESFSALAAEALDANARRLAEQAGAALDGKKALIDQALAAMGERLERVRQVLQTIEADRKQDFGQISSSVSSLAGTASELHKMLASTQRRGAWGERMAEDVLRLAGLAEGVNYNKQSSRDADASRPDFTFYLPNELKVNMDVKFPLERYKTFLDAQTDESRAAEMEQLVAAVRGHVKDVSRRGYIDPNAPTVPYVIVFIPSEQIYSLVLEARPDLMDEALSMKVVLAGPLTLYAMLDVIRQAAENANIMRTADEVISLLGVFEKQWQAFKEAMDVMGRRIDDVKKEYDTLVGRRARMLERPLAKIEQLRNAQQLPPQPEESQDSRT